MSSGRKRPAKSIITSTLQTVLLFGHPRERQSRADHPCLSRNNKAQVAEWLGGGGRGGEGYSEGLLRLAAAANTGSTEGDMNAADGGLMRKMDAAEPVERTSISNADENAPLFKRVIGMLERLRRRVGEVPEDAADEGRFLMMAALVGVLTGTAGVFFFFFCMLLRVRML